METIIGAMPIRRPCTGETEVEQRVQTTKIKRRLKQPISSIKLLVFYCLIGKNSNDFKRSDVRVVLPKTFILRFFTEIILLVFRRSITQNNDLWPLDAVLFVCSTLISITAVLLYFLTIKAQVLETIAFNERLRTATNNGELRVSRFTSKKIVCVYKRKLLE